MKHPLFLSSVLALVFTLLTPGSLVAQAFYGDDAAARNKDANILRMEDGQSRPQFIQFRPERRPVAGALEKYLDDNGQKMAGESFRLHRQDADELGITHRTYHQYIHGARVVGGVFKSRVRNGLIESVGGELYDRFGTEHQPALTPREALRTMLEILPAEKYAGPSGEGEALDYPAPGDDLELVWVPEALDFDGPFKLAYAATIHGVQPLFRKRLYVSAADGRLLAAENLLPHGDEEGTAITRYSGERTITTDLQTDGTYRLREAGRNISTINENATTDTRDFIDDDNHWNNVNSAQDEVATDAHWAAEVYYDLLEDMGRNSIDDEGGELISVVHHGNGVGNAFWDGTASYYGDGDPLSTLDRPLVSPEVVGHEFTHGLVDYTAELIYSGESGGLNESFADIFGYMNSYVGRGAEDTPWLIGAEVTSTGLGIRSFVAPNAYFHPDTYGGEYWSPFSDVHVSSSVQNHWFYLLATGGTGTNDLDNTYDVAGVGVDTAFTIAYRNLVHYLTASSDYADAAFYAQMAAADLYGSCSEAYVATANAWYAVGVGSPVATETTAGFAAQRLFCSAPAMVAFTNTSSLSDAWQWDFGDGTTSDLEMPVHTYENFGSYTVTLTVSGCDGQQDTLVLDDYVVVDDALAVCDTIRMVPGETITSTSCEGLITDSGGIEENYQNSEESAVFISGPTGSTISLSFSEFNLEESWDFLRIYDGPNENGQLIGAYDGDDLLGQTVVSSGPELFLLFDSDGSVTRSGFIGSYNINGGAVAAVAGFELSAEELLYNQPLMVSPADTLVGSVVFYDFGDGVRTDGEASVTHQYREAGNFLITQVVRTCMEVDTSYRQVTVALPGSFTFSPDSVCLTVNAGDTVARDIVLRNGGPGVLYYDMDVVEGGESSTLEFSSGNRETTHDFRMRSTATELTLDVTVNGDFEQSFRYAEVFIEGLNLGTIGQDDESAPVGTDIRKTFEVPAIAVPAIVADGRVAVTVRNAQFSSANGGDRTHTVRSRYAGGDFQNLAAATAGTIAAEDSLILPLTIDATGLLGGVFYTSLFFETGDSLRSRDTLPVKVTVIGQPQLIAQPDTTDFGSVFITVPDTMIVTLDNPGTDTLFLSGAELTDNTNFSRGDLPPQIAPGGRDSFWVEYSPTLNTDHLTDIIISSNVEDVTVTAVGNGLLKPEIIVTPDSLCFLIEGDGTQTLPITINNPGGGDLTWEIRPADYSPRILMWTFQVSNTVTESLRGVLEARFPNGQVVETAANAATQMEEALDGVDILVIPRSFHSFYDDVAQPVNDFLARGGGILLLRNGDDVLRGFNLGFYSESFISGEVVAVTPDHPLLENIDLPLSMSGMYGLNNFTPVPGSRQPILTDGFRTYAGMLRTGGGEIIYAGIDLFGAPTPDEAALIGNAAEILSKRLPEYMTASPNEGTNEGGTTMMVDITADATGLEAGTYRFTLFVDHNVPGQGPVRVPVKLDFRTSAQAAFTVSDEETCDGFVSFTDNSTALPTSWAWDFGDGTASTQRNPSHQYTTSGTYTVELEVCNELGCTTASTTIIVNLIDEFCREIFLTDNLTVTEMGCTGTIYDDGGPDGNYSNSVEATIELIPANGSGVELEIVSFLTESCCDRLIVYDGPAEPANIIGTYRGTDLEPGDLITVEDGYITLFWDTDGSVALSGFEIRWQCLGVAPVAALEAEIDADCPNEYSFTNLSSDAVSYLWDFGDGLTSTEASPTHAYAELGAYTVVLTASNEFGESTVSETIVVVQVPFSVELDFPDTVLTNEIIGFSAQSEAVLSSTTWNLGIGNDVTIANPMFVYQEPGEYLITLTAESSDGCTVTVFRTLTVLLNTSLNNVAPGVEIRTLSQSGMEYGQPERFVAGGCRHGKRAPYGCSRPGGMEPRLRNDDRPAGRDRRERTTCRRISRPDSRGRAANAGGADNYQAMNQYLSIPISVILFAKLFRRVFPLLVVP